MAKQEKQKKKAGKKTGKLSKKPGKSKRAAAGRGRPARAKKATKLAARAEAQPTPVLPGELVAPAEIDVALFEEAYGRVLARAQALPKAAVLTFNVDLQMAALVALKAAQVATEPKLRRRFANLAKSGEYNDEPVGALADVAMATWYARYRGIHSERADAGPPPVELSAQGFKLRSLMLRVIEYNLDDNPKVMKQVAIIRTGSGFLDLANDLTAVADLYVANAKELVGDTRRYKETDVAEARRLASALLTYLGSGVEPPATGWADIQARCWTLLSKTYAEVQRGGIFLLPGEDGERRFPSLVAAARDLAGPSTPSEPKAAPDPAQAP